MPRSVEAILADSIGRLTIQNATLVARIEALEEEHVKARAEIASLKAELLKPCETK